MSIKQQQDRLSKWFIEHQTGAFLKLCDVQNVVSYRLENNELIVPKRIPDALIQVQFDDEPDEAPYIIEIESYPSEDNFRQMAEAQAAYFLSHQRWPGAILLVLKHARNAVPNQPTPAMPITEEITFRSKRGKSRGIFQWNTIHFWEIQAEALFAQNDPSVVPLIPLTQSTQSPEELIRRCYQVIQDSDHPDKQNLLLITELVISFVYNDNPALLELLRNPKMIEFPIITKLTEITLAEGRKEGRKEGRDEGIELGRNQGIELGRNQGIELGRSAMIRAILDVLETRFEQVPDSIMSKLGEITELEALKPLIKLAALCTDLNTFERAL